jgi:class 3 adenylate cyclase
MDESSRTLVCSVLFLDIVDYSMMGVEQQLQLKQRFNAALLNALKHVAAEERVVIDTGDGAAVAVLGNPERALFVALAIFDSTGDLNVRAGVNLGPVSLMKDINGQSNVIGDGINVAQRVMGFAGKGELLVSRSFFEVISLLSGDYATMFSALGSRTDKHSRAHDVYAVSPGVRVGRRMADARSARSPDRDAGGATGERRGTHISDAGSHFIVSGYSEAGVHEALERLVKEGRRATGPVTQIGSKWYASVDNPRLAAKATVEALGFTRIVTGPSREAVEEKVREELEYGARLVEGIQLADGVWTAVCEKT